jgi:hypothetical protein
MCEVGGDRLTDEESLERGEQSFFGNGILPTTDGVS